MNTFQAGETKAGPDGTPRLSVRDGDGQNRAPAFDWIESARRRFAERYAEEMGWKQ